MSAGSVVIVRVESNSTKPLDWPPVEASRGLIRLLPGLLTACLALLLSACSMSSSAQGSSKNSTQSLRTLESEALTPRALGRTWTELEPTVSNNHVRFSTGTTCHIESPAKGSGVVATLFSLRENTTITEKLWSFPDAEKEFGLIRKALSGGCLSPPGYLKSGPLVGKANEIGFVGTIPQARQARVFLYYLQIGSVVFELDVSGNRASLGLVKLAIKRIK